MREHVSQSKKANTASFSIPSLKHRIPGFGLDSSQASPQAVPLVQPLHKPLTHDISRIPLRNPQAKLSISQPGDKYEQEADSVAQQVMQRIAQPVNRQSIQPEALPESEELQMKPMANSIRPLVQRQEMPEDEEELQMKSLDNSTLQRQEVPEDDEELQMKPIVQRRAEAGMAATPDVETFINQARGGGQSMADNIRQPMEQAFGADFSRVKVHTDGQSDQLNRSIQARAFTTGQDMFFRSGEYNPGSRGGQELIAHELTHVVQQNGRATRSHPIQKQSTLKIVQRAGDYSGLLPDHDVEKNDAYDFGQQNKRKKEFTYHHIIPENTLTKVYDKIKILLDKTKDIEGEQEDRLHTQTKELKSGGRKLWLDTRAKNTAYTINTNFSDYFSDYGVSVTPEQLRPLIEANTSLDTLFSVIRDLIKHQFESVFVRMKTEFLKAIKKELNERAFERDWQQKNAGNTIMTILEPFNISGKSIFKANELEHIVHTTPYQNLNGPGTNKSTLVSLIGDYAKSKTFNDFYSQSFPELVVEKKGDKNYLYTNVSEKGLPRDNQDELRDAMEWNPGNIHRGPKSSYRLDPNSVSQFKALLDDGGDRFEYAAVNLVDTKHFVKLELLSRNIPYLLKADTDNLSQQTLTLAGGIIGQMLDIQAHGVTKFQESSWEKHEDNKMRVKQNDDNIRAAKGITSIALLGKANNIQEMD